MGGKRASYFSCNIWQRKTIKMKKVRKTNKRPQKTTSQLQMKFQSVKHILTEDTKEHRAE